MAGAGDTLPISTVDWQHIMVLIIMRIVFAILCLPAALSREASLAALPRPRSEPRRAASAGPTVRAHVQPPSAGPGADDSAPGPAAVRERAHGTSTVSTDSDRQAPGPTRSAARSPGAPGVMVPAPLTQRADYPPPSAGAAHGPPLGARACSAARAAHIF